MSNQEYDWWHGIVEFFSFTVTEHLRVTGVMNIIANICRLMATVAHAVQSFELQPHEPEHCLFDKYRYSKCMARNMWLHKLYKRSRETEANVRDYRYHWSHPAGYEVTHKSIKSCRCWMWENMLEELQFAVKYGVFLCVHYLSIWVSAIYNADFSKRIRQWNCYGHVT